MRKTIIKIAKKPRKIYPVAMPNPGIRTVNGITYQWLPNPTVKVGGYWRRIN